MVAPCTFRYQGNRKDRPYPMRSATRATARVAPTLNVYNALYPIMQNRDNREGPLAITYKYGYTKWILRV